MDADFSVGLTGRYSCLTRAKTRRATRILAGLVAAIVTPAFYRIDSAFPDMHSLVPGSRRQPGGRGMRDGPGNRPVLLSCRCCMSRIRFANARSAATTAIIRQWICEE